VLSSSKISSWSTLPYGQSVSGNLIQIPALGTASAIVVNDTNVTANGQLILTDADLCGIFSGKLTNFNQFPTVKGSVVPAAGAFAVVYRTDSAAATFLLTNHLAAVCTTGTGGNSNITFTATTTFASLFPSGVGTAIPGAVGEKGSAGVANYLAGLSSAGAVPQGIGYLSPDWTSIPRAPDSQLSNGETSPLLVAALLNGKRSYLPTTTNIALGLDHPAIATTLTPPSTAAEGALASNWVPVIQTTTEGYPIVGYGTFDLAQCYSNKAISTGLVAYLKLHYTNATYTAIQTNNGLVQIANAGASKFLAAVQKNILANSNKWATDLGDKSVCAKLTGR
jgi:ABC-type phosphate transport system substrate-binding protein